MAFYKDLSNSADTNKYSFAFIDIGDGIIDQDKDIGVYSGGKTLSVGDYVLEKSNNSVWQKVEGTNKLCLITKLDYGEQFDFGNITSAEGIPYYSAKDKKLSLLKIKDGGNFLGIVIPETGDPYLGHSEQTVTEESKEHTLDGKATLDFDSYETDKYGHVTKIYHNTVKGLLNSTTGAVVIKSGDNTPALQFEQTASAPTSVTGEDKKLYIALNDASGKTGTIYYKDGSNLYTVGLGKVEEIKDASENQSGKVNTTQQTFAGEKTFANKVVVKNGISVEDKGISTNALTASGTISAKSVNTTESISSEGSISANAVEAKKIDVSPWSIKIDSENALVFSITVNDETPAPETGENENE